MPDFFIFSISGKNSQIAARLQEVIESLADFLNLQLRLLPSVKTKTFS